MDRVACRRESALPCQTTSDLLTTPQTKSIRDTALAFNPHCQTLLRLHVRTAPGTAVLLLFRLFRGAEAPQRREEAGPGSAHGGCSGDTRGMPGPGNALTQLDARVPARHGPAVRAQPGSARLRPAGSGGAAAPPRGDGAGQGSRPPGGCGDAAALRCCVTIPSGKRHSIILAFAFMYQLSHAGIDRKCSDTVQSIILFSRSLV